MVLKIRLKQGPRLRQRPDAGRSVAMAVASLMMPVALMAATLAGWRLASDLDLADEFAISQGLFSHWQVWLVTAGLLVVAAMRLRRYGDTEVRPRGAETAQEGGRRVIP